MEVWHVSVRTFEDPSSAAVVQNQLRKIRKKRSPPAAGTVPNGTVAPAVVLQVPYGLQPEAFKMVTFW